MPKTDWLGQVSLRVPLPPSEVNLGFSFSLAFGVLVFSSRL